MTPLIVVYEPEWNGKKQLKLTVGRACQSILDAV